MLLGHRGLAQAAIYVHLSRRHLQAIGFTARARTARPMQVWHELIKCFPVFQKMAPGLGPGLRAKRRKTGSSNLLVPTVFQFHGHRNYETPFSPISLKRPRRLVRLSRSLTR
jgi:hypothetical protein